VGLLGQAGFQTSHPGVRPTTDFSRLQRVSHNVDRFRVSALPLLDLPALSSGALGQALLHPTELHKVAAAGKGSQSLKRTMSEEDLGITVLNPRGIMGK
jgi:hypothetical protein